MAVARVTEVTASSKKGWDDCAKEAVAAAPVATAAIKK